MAIKACDSEIVNVVAGIILKDKRVLIAKRSLDKHQGGLWEFPGGKIEHSETANQALIRELKEEINLDITDPTYFQDIEFDYSDKRVHITFLLVSEFSGEAEGLEGQQIRWVRIEDLEHYPFPKANQSIVSKLISENY